MKVLHACALFIGAAFLHGCAFAPGQHLDTSTLLRQDDATEGRVEFVAITPKLVAMDTAMRGQFQVPHELLDYKPDAYRIGAGDTLYITIWEHPELTAPAGPQQQTLANGRLVGPDGMLFYPYAGDVKAAGLTIAELRQTIAKRLAEYVENPQVDVTVIGYTSQRVVLEGAFVKTDAQPIDVTPLTLARALGTAVINTEQANISGLILKRDGVDYHLDLDAMRHGGHLANDIYLKDGDRIFLPYNDRQEAYVVGEVNRPGPLPFKIADLTLSQALGRAGGLNQTTAKGKSVYVIRGMKGLDSEPARVYNLDARSPVAFSLADEFRVLPGDVVFVGPAGVTRWNRLLSQLLPLSGLISNAATANYNFDRSQ